MGDTIWVDIQGRTELPADLSCLLLFQEALDRLSRQLGVAKLSDFYDNSNLYEEFLNEANESSAAVWFEPAQALTAVRALHEHLTRHPEALEFSLEATQQHLPEMLGEELQHCAAALAEAVAHRQLFRFLIVG